MQSAPKPANEYARLKALYDYQILDTEAEKVFDDLTELAAHICETPIALISLVDPDRQWFKSKVGLDAEETSRDIAFCAHAIHEKHIFEVCDTLSDPRFADNPLVTNDPNIRFYAGAPLITPDGQAIGTLCTINNKPAKLNDHQRRSLELLSREVIAQLELRKRIQEEKRANERKTEFLSHMSHELRTPLNAILSFSHLLLSDSQSELSATQRQQIKHIDYCSKHLLELVNGLLDIQKIEAGKMKIVKNWVNFTATLAPLMQLLAPQATSKAVTLNLNVDEKIPQNLFLDAARFGQVLMNLVTNGIKFSDHGQSVDVVLQFHNNHLILLVKDYGHGISEADQSKLFQQFEQVGKQSMPNSSGLGLVISKRIVELMGGTIHLSSAINKGTLVKVQLPMETDVGREDLSVLNQETQVVSHQYSQRANILVVEDNFLNQQVAEAIFDNLGLSIDLAESAERALEILQVKTFDIVFMDINLPGMNGIECSREIHKDLPNLPVVALTADVFALKDDEKTTTFFEAVLNKPIDINSLIKVLNEQLPRSL